MKKLLIAIDGYAACGKSTLAKQLAAHLHYLFLDTGAMYRAVTLYFLEHGINWLDTKQLDNAFNDISIAFQRNENGIAHTFLNGDDVEEEIRSMRVSNKVSEVAAVSAVRKFLVKQQQEIGKQKGVVMDGRDIGTVVFPDADLKLFITADMDTRVQRRLLELQSNDIQVSEADIRNNLIKRDYEETSRADSPLVQAADAILIDNTHLTLQQQFDMVLQLVEQRAN